MSRRFCEDYAGVHHTDRQSQTNKLTRRFVTAKTLAVRYACSARHILLLAARKEIPSIRVGIKCVRFDEQAVAAVLEGNADA